MSKLSKYFVMLFAVLTLFACSLSTEELADNVKENMKEQFTPKGITVKSLMLSKKAGNEYTGILETIEPNGAFTYAVEVIYDGNTFTWQVKND
jgi:hypothetical protein